MMAALYARVSTSRQAQKDLSIPDQINQMRSWCEPNGYHVCREFIEPGMSGTDDRRPELSRMMEEACTKPSPFDAIIVHSLSRFFRDQIEFGLHERTLKKYNVKIISITQQTSDDPAGEMTRTIFNVFDEYQSKENSKHTLRAMKENARRGNFNGAPPPFGYRTVETDLLGRGGKKKKLEIDPDEAAIVQKVFSLYLNGYHGNRLGLSGLIKHLNDRGTLRRGKRWYKPSLRALLVNKAYIGEYFFNKVVSKTKEVKPKEEWIPVDIQPIIGRDIFEGVQQLLDERNPTNTCPRTLSSPTLLTGLLKCSCGAGMTLATGKGGRYRYYKCVRRMNVGKDACKSKNIPMDRLDSMILDAIANKIFRPERVKTFLNEFIAGLNKHRSQDDDKLLQLNKEFDALELSINRLLEAIENGIVPLDDNIKERAHANQKRRQDLLNEIDALKQRQTMPKAIISHQNIEQFCSLL